MSNGHEATLRRFQDPVVRQGTAMDDLVRRAVFGLGGGGGPDREQARWLIWEIGQQAGVRPASIHELYLARGRGEVPPFTTPAMNLRVLAYDTARAVFRAARRLDVGALICEIARSEIGYTDQRPAEYVAVMTAAARREGFVGPLFIQGDHVQVNAKKYAADPEAELQAFMEGYNRTLQRLGPYRGISKISVQTGTSHGGVVLPDGSIAKVQLDLDALKALSRDARATYGLGGAVQHGASTLPAEAFGAFPACEAIEIHLATNFQNIVFDHPKLPADVRSEINEWVKSECKDEWKKGDTEQQFIYKARKKAIGPFKQRLWDLPAPVRDAVAADLEKTFAFLFEQLRVTHTRAVVDRFVRPPLQSHAQPRAVAVAAPDDLEAGE